MPQVAQRSNLSHLPKGFIRPLHERKEPLTCKLSKETFDSIPRVERYKYIPLCHDGHGNYWARNIEVRYKFFNFDAQVHVVELRIPSLTRDEWLPVWWAKRLITDEPPRLLMDEEIKHALILQIGEIADKEEFAAQRDALLTLRDELITVHKVNVPLD